MPLTDPPALLVAFAAVLALGSLIQSAAGFGFALFTVPLLMVLGCRSYEAIVLVAVAASANAIAGVWHLRRHVHWPRAGHDRAASLAMPLGVAVLGVLADQDRVVVRRVFGGVVLLALSCRPCVARRAARPAPARPTVAPCSPAVSWAGSRACRGCPPCCG